MSKPKQLWSLALLSHHSSAPLTLALAMVCGLALLAIPKARAQTFSVIHNFTNGGDGGVPRAGVSIKPGVPGILYGTTADGGLGNGVVYQAMHMGSNWATLPISFLPGGENPLARVVFGPDGHPYGTTFYGGDYSVGAVFDLIVPLTICKTASCPWKENVLYSFAGGSDGKYPSYGDLTWDDQGNIYGTASAGGNGDGTVYELQPPQPPENKWTETILYRFTGTDGKSPNSSVTFDKSHNLLGTTYVGGPGGSGNVFKLTKSGSGYTAATVYNFQGLSDGAYPFAGLVMDGSGNLFGAATGAGTGGGTAFELVPSGDNYTFKVIYTFSGQGTLCGPWGTLTLYNGDLYGTTACDGADGYGNVFKLSNGQNGWVYTSLHQFTGGNDGAYPISNVTIDTDGTLYGTTSSGGSQNFGVVWQIIP